MSEEFNEFYAKHRGGSGAVIVVTAQGPDELEVIEVFSNIEAAEAWIATLGEDFICIFSPHIVDEPEWGNKAAH